MPDGRPLGQYLLHEQREAAKGGPRRTRSRRGKDEVWQQLQSHVSRHNNADWEAAELHVLQVVGHRRRRRWLNEKVLRDMAGPMTAADMENQFKPVPFGIPSRSMLAEAIEQVGQPVWDRLRNISWDKQAAVLQRWEEHVSGSGSRGKSGHSAASLALERWARIERKARVALRQANPHSVMDMEAPVLDFLQGKGEDSESLVLQPPDSFARLLAHGLAAFHGLRSLSVPSPQPGEPKLVVLTRPPPQPTPLAPEAGASPRDASAAATATAAATAMSPSAGGVGGSACTTAVGCGGGGGSRSATPTAGARASSRSGTPLRAGAADGGGGGGAGGSRSCTPLRASADGKGGSGGVGAQHVTELACADVLMAAQELGPVAGLSVRSLERYMRAHLHGIEDERDGRGHYGLRACL